MMDGVNQTADRVAGSPPWPPRETKLLAVTLRLLQRHGYKRLKVDAVAATARASKGTVIPVLAFQSGIGVDRVQRGRPPGGGPAQYPHAARSGPDAKTHSRSRLGRQLLFGSLSYYGPDDPLCAHNLYAGL